MRTGIRDLLELAQDLKHAEYNPQAETTDMDEESTFSLPPPPPYRERETLDAQSLVLSHSPPKLVPIPSPGKNTRIPQPPIRLPLWTVPAGSIFPP
jgi:hypothetical protein